MALTLPAYLLSGGRSRRFGTDKARQLVDDREMIRVVADVFRARSMPVIAVARERRAYDDLGIVTIADVVPSKGPVAGIISAIDDWKKRRRSGGDEWVLISACDWVGLDPAWVDTLLHEVAGGDQVVLFRSQFAETLFALYHVSVETELRQCIARGDVTLHECIQAFKCKELPCPPEWDQVVNANRPDDLEPNRDANSRRAG